MVGIPGRSKGCNTCRKRKIGCDATKPYCKKCSATGRQCEGYETYPVFMVWTNNGYAKRSRLDELKTPSTQAPSTKTPSEVPLPTDSFASWSPLPASPPSSSVWSSQITGLFFDSILSTIDVFNRDVGVLWLREAYNIANPSKVLGHAVKALAAVRVSWQIHDTELLVFSQKTYSKALIALQTAVRDPEEVCHDHTFIAARTMVMYETLASTSNDTSSWKSHVDGLSMLLKVRGPRPFVTECGRAALEDVRDSVMIRTAMDRKGHFLGTGPWADLPWIDNSKHPRQHVADIGFAIASLLEHADTIFPPFENTPYRQTVALDILGKLRDFLHRFDSIELENSDATGDEYEVTFKDLQSAVATLHCWALNLYMRLLCVPLCDMLEADPDVFWNHPEAESTLTELRTRLGEAECRRICRKINAGARFCLREEMRYVGSRRLTFPLLAANYFLWQQKLPELQECQRLTKQACEGSGVAMGKHVTKGISEKFLTFGRQQRAKVRDAC